MTNQEDFFEFQAEILAENATPDDLDRMTRQLVAELRDLEIETVSLLSGGQSPVGTKSADAVTIGAVAIAVLPTFLPKVVESIQTWALRGHGRTVKFKGKINGQMIEFEGHSEDLEKLLAKFSKGNKKK